MDAPRHDYTLTYSLRTSPSQRRKHTLTATTPTEARALLTTFLGNLLLKIHRTDRLETPPPPVA